MGLRRLCRVYSALSFADIATKLCLSSEHEAEEAASKAIASHTIDAVIVHPTDSSSSSIASEPPSSSSSSSANHQELHGAYLSARTATDMFATTHPRDELEARIDQCDEMNQRLQKVCFLYNLPFLCCNNSYIRCFLFFSPILSPIRIYRP